MFLESSQNWLRDIGSGVIADFYLHTHTAPFVTDGLIYSSFRAVLLKIQLHPTGMAQDTALSEWYGSRYSSIRLIWLKIWIYPSDMAQDTAPSDWYDSRYGFIRVIWLKIQLHPTDMAQDMDLSEWYGSRYSSIRLLWLKIQLYPSDMTQDTLHSCDMAQVKLLPRDKAQNITPPDGYGSRCSSFRVRWLKILPLWYDSRYSSIRVIWLKLSSFRGIKLKILLHRIEMAQDAAPFEWDGSKYYPYWVMWLKLHLLPSNRAQNTTPSEWDGLRYSSFRERWFKILLLSIKMTQDAAPSRARCLKTQLFPERDASRHSFSPSEMPQDTAFPRARCLKIQLLSSEMTLYTASDFCSEGTPFESWPWHGLFWLRLFVVALSFPGKTWCYIRLR